MINKDSSIGIVEDIITNIMNMIANEYHIEILIRKYEDQIKFWYNDGNPELQEAGDTDKIIELEGKITELTLLLKQVTDERRNAMRLLKSQANTNGNPDLWCLLKHVLVAVETAFEAWQVDLNDVYVKQAFIEQSRIANQVLAMFLGYEVTPCSACLTDQLKEDNK